MLPWNVLGYHVAFSLEDLSADPPEMSIIVPLWWHQ